MAAKPRRTMKQIKASARIRKEAAGERRRWKARMGAAVKAAGGRPTSVTIGTTQVKSKGGSSRKMFTVTGVWPGYGPSRPIIRKSVSRDQVEEIGARWKAGKPAKRSALSGAALSNPYKKRKSSAYGKKAKSNPRRNSKGRFVKANPGRKSSRRR